MRKSKSKPKKFEKESYKKRFFRKNNPLLRSANRIINNLDGDNEERLGQFEMIEQSQQFKEKYSALRAKDIALLVKAQLGKY